MGAFRPVMVQLSGHFDDRYVSGLGSTLAGVYQIHDMAWNQRETSGLLAQRYTDAKAKSDALISQHQVEEKRCRDLLRQTLAQKRAWFAARGIAPHGGSQRPCCMVLRQKAPKKRLLPGTRWTAGSAGRHRTGSRQGPIVLTCRAPGPTRNQHALAWTNVLSRPRAA
ncbi:MAG: hypothetical protein FD153_1061 [Rhodospirillaceae bacterium]|nr:MAG: hypothetical protein FD153_1061 [Rhodospirillaceae bacterium]